MPVPDPQEFLALVMQTLEVSTDRELAKVLGLTGYDAPSRVRNWRTGKNKPDYEATMLMLEKAGMLRDSPGSAVSVRVGDARLTEAEVAQAIRELADAVDAQTARLDELQPREAEPAPTRSRKQTQEKRRTA